MHQAERHDQSNGSEQFIALFLTPHCLRQFASVLCWCGPGSRRLPGPHQHIEWASRRGRREVKKSYPLL